MTHMHKSRTKMHIMKKACGLLAVVVLGLNISACSTADKGSSSVPTVIPVAPTIGKDSSGNSKPFTLSPQSVATGQTSNLSWVVAGAKSCTASGDTSNGKWTGHPDPSGSATVGPYSTAGDYTYVLTCTSETGGVLSQTATLHVGTPASTVGVVLASNSNKAKPGETVSLTWSTSGNPTSCVAESNPSVDDWSGMNVPTNGPTTGEWVTMPNVAGNYILKLTCSGPDGSASSSVPVTVADDAGAKSAPPLLRIFADPSSVSEGGSSSISWMTANVAGSCDATSSKSGDGWNNSTQPANDINGSTAATFNTPTTLTPNTYAYRLRCVGKNGDAVSQAAQLLVTGGNANNNVAPTLSFSVSDSTNKTGSNSITVKVGSRAYLSWVSTNASQCVASGGTWASSAEPTSYDNLPQGPFTSPGNYSYALTCSNPSGNSVAQVVQVSVIGNGPGVSFSAQPGTVTKGMSATLVWAASPDATSCTAVSGPMQDSGWTGTQPTSGNHAIPASVYNAPGSYDYVLSCTSPSGTTTVPVEFVVNSDNTGNPQFTGAFSASPNSLPAGGGSTSLSWATSNATACTATSNPPVTGWNGSQPSSSPSGGTSVTFPANTGASPISYTLELTCSNSSGSSTQMQVITVQGATPLPTVTLSADPTTVVAGPDATTTLTYSTSNATQCFTDRDNATGVWSAPAANTGPTPVTGQATSAPMTVAQDYLYTLSCEGPGGTTKASVTVTATSPAPRFMPVKDQSATDAKLFVTTVPGDTVTKSQTVAPGGPLYFSWNTVGTQSCAPSSNEPGTSSWANTATGTSGDDVPATASNVPGDYTYTITCKGPLDPPAISTVSVRVISPTASLCPKTPSVTGMEIPSMALLKDMVNAPSYLASTPSATGSSLCVGCSVGATPNLVTNVTDAQQTAATSFPYGFDNYASMILPVGVLAANAEEINVSKDSVGPVVYPAGRTVNVGLVVPDGLVVASVLGNVSISTTLNGVVQDATPQGLLALQLLGLTGGSGRGYATLPTTKPFDGVRVNFGGTVKALSELDVHMACVSLY